MPPESILSKFSNTGPSPSTPRIRHHLQVEEERLQSIWRIKVQQLCAGQDRASFPDRGTEDREEGAEGDGDQDCGQEMSVTVGAWFCGNGHGTIAWIPPVRSAYSLQNEIRYGTARISGLFT